jgi:CubicO group peptidase (beta-lactamase class C family)
MRRLPLALRRSLRNTVPWNPALPGTILATLLAAVATAGLVAPSGVAAAPPADDTGIRALPSVDPAKVGLSAERLARIDAVMEEHVEAGRVAGAIGLVARHGQVAYLSTWGWADREAKQEMTPDALFRMYSMTKAVTGVAIMMLHEEQGWPLSTPAKQWIPELGEPQVAVYEVDPGTGTPRHRLVPARRDITIRDLLTHTSGISYAGPRDAQGDFYYRKIASRADGERTIGQLARDLGEAPLHSHPGEVWQYGLSQDVLAALVEVMSGQTWDVFLEERIFGPLGMKDTAHWAPESKHARLTALYTPTDDGKIARSQAPAQESYKSKPVQLGGGSGLVSSVGDYLRFCQMLLNGGELDGVRLLSPKSVELMAADHIGDLPRIGDLIGPNDGFGLTFRVVREPGLSGALGSPGEYSWGGAAGTRFWIDPHEDLIGLFMIQILPHTDLGYGTQFKNLVYQSIVGK